MFVIYHPIVLFVYKRLSVIQQVVDALLRNPGAKESNLVVFSDGAKNETDMMSVNDVRAYINQVRGFKSIELICRDENLGLAGSFISGITEILDRFESAIFIEDDNLVSPGFLEFMNNCLELYKNDERVSCVTGYSFPIWPPQSKPYFVRGAETWSVGIWRRSWQHFCADGNLLKTKLKNRNLVAKFSRDGFGFYPMLLAQINGKIDSWGVRWWTSAFVDNMYYLMPHKPLCVSIGYGLDSVHCKDYSYIFRSSEELADKISLDGLPTKTEQTFRTTAQIIIMNVVIIKVMSIAYRFCKTFECKLVK